MPFFVITIVFGLLWKRANWQGVLIGYLAGVTAGGISAYVRGIATFDAFFFSTMISTAVTLVVTVLATPFFPRRSDEQLDPIWKARTHDDLDHGTPYHIIPISGWGRFFFVLFFIGLAMFLAGTISASVEYAHASALALWGMILYFLAGLLRLSFD
jgi:SSS family solute:Na+ symporter